MAVFLLECKEDEERQASYSNKETLQSILEKMTSFANSVTLLEI